MKIKTFKYIILYIVLIFLSIFLVKNFSSFSLYIKNFSDIQKIEETKKTDKIEINKDFNLANIEKLLSGLNYQDISNLYTIGEKFDKAENIIKSKNEYNYQDFYNLGNIYFLKSYEKFKNNGTGYIESIQNAISYYNYALETIPDYKRKDFIINNDNLAKDFLSYLYFYECNQFFIKLIKKNTNLLNLLDKLEQTLKRQIKQLNKWEQYNEIKKCIRQFESDAVRNLSIIADNKTFFQETKKGIINLMKSYIEDGNLCYKNQPLFKEKYEKSLESSIKYFNEFNKTQSQLLYVFEKGNLDSIKKLCNNKSKLAKKQNKKNQEMMKNFDKMKDLLKPQQQKKENKQEKGGKKENKPGPKEYEKLEKQTKEIEKKAKNTLKKVQERKTKQNYNPMDYINRIFNGFYGNKEDFIEGKKENTTGK